jgi:hypothetical protein
MYKILRSNGGDYQEYSRLGCLPHPTVFGVRLIPLVQLKQSSKLFLWHAHGISLGDTGLQVWINSVYEIISKRNVSRHLKAFTVNYSWLLNCRNWDTCRILQEKSDRTWRLQTKSGIKRLKLNNKSLLANILQILSCVIRIAYFPGTLKAMNIRMRYGGPAILHPAGLAPTASKQLRPSLDYHVHILKKYERVLLIRATVGNCFTQINHVTNLNTNDTTKTRLTKMKNGYWSLRMSVCWKTNGSSVTRIHLFCLRPLYASDCIYFSAVAVF